MASTRPAFASFSRRASLISPLLDAFLPDCPAPARDLALKQLAELFWRGGRGDGARLDELVAHHRIVEDVVDGLVEPGDHRGRRLCGGGQARPVVRFRGGRAGGPACDGGVWTRGRAAGACRPGVATSAGARRRTAPSPVRRAGR